MTKLLTLSNGVLLNRNNVEGSLKEVVINANSSYNTGMTNFLCILQSSTTAIYIASVNNKNRTILIENICGSSDSWKPTFSDENGKIVINNTATWTRKFYLLDTN